MCTTRYCSSSLLAEYNYYEADTEVSELTGGTEFTRSTKNDSVLTGGAEHTVISQARVLTGEAEHSQPTQASVLTGDTEPTLPTQESVLTGDAETQPELSEGLDGKTGETVNSRAGTSPLQLITPTGPSGDAGARFSGVSPSPNGTDATGDTAPSSTYYCTAVKEAKATETWWEETQMQHQWWGNRAKSNC